MNKPNDMGHSPEHYHKFTVPEDKVAETLEEKQRAVLDECEVELRNISRLVSSHAPISTQTLKDINLLRMKILNLPKL